MDNTTNHYLIFDMINGKEYQFTNIRATDVDDIMNDFMSSNSYIIIRFSNSSQPSYIIAKQHIVSIRGSTLNFFDTRICKQCNLFTKEKCPTCEE